MRSGRSKRRKTVPSTWPESHELEKKAREEARLYGSVTSGRYLSRRDLLFFLSLPLHTYLLLILLLRMPKDPPGGCPAAVPAPSMGRRRV